MRQQEEAEADPGDGQRGADRLLRRTGPAPGPYAVAEPGPVPGFEGGGLLGVAHHPRELPLEAVEAIALARLIPSAELIALAQLIP
ncbi:hypothetical protein [Streptomyces sp. R08]|uniref:Uncharacterized protein n=1 Tax=Streptomyces sp. R08 TaxID=3238624 RepID=A0AB39MKT3_9ACTN